MIKIRFTILLTALLCSATAIASTPANYVGIDYLYRNMQGRNHNNSTMGNVLGHDYNSLDIYLAHRFNSDVGISLGYEESKTVKQNYTFSAGEMFLGDRQNAGDTSSMQTRLQEIHFDVNGYYNSTDNFELLGQLGLGLMRTNMQGSVVASNITTNLNPSNNFEIVPRISFGMQYLFGGKIGLRGLVSWEGTNMYVLKINDEDGSRMSIKPFKQSWTVGIGLVGKF